MSKLQSGLAERVRLCGGGHAIDRVCLGVEWESPLDQASMMELSALAQELTALPRRIELRSSESSMGESGPERTSYEEQSELVEIMLDNNQSVDESKDDKTLEVVIRPQALFFQVMASTYSSWTNTKGLATSLTKGFLNKILALRQPNSVGIQIFDSFSFERGIPFSDLFNEDGEYVPGAIFKKDAYWRFDQSYYEAGGPDFSVLTNCQVLHSPTSGSEKEDNIVIACLHRVDFSVEKNITIDEMHAHYDFLYRKNKNLVSKLLSEGMRDLIGIKFEEENCGRD